MTDQLRLEIGDYDQGLILGVVLLPIRVQIGTRWGGGYNGS